VESSNHLKTGRHRKARRVGKIKIQYNEKNILTTLTTLFTLALCFSQYVITKKSGEDIQAKILKKSFMFNF
jgi:hypothetical protein